MRLPVSSHPVIICPERKKYPCHLSIRGTDYLQRKNVCQIRLLRDRTRMDASIFFPTFNRKDIVRETLTRLSVAIDCDYTIEIVVVDNCSTDGTPQMIENEFPYVRLVRLPYNFGAISARNIAVKNTCGEILISVDDDSFPGIDCISNALDIFHKNRRLGLMPLVVYPHHDYIDKYEDAGFFQENKKEVHTDLWSGCGGIFRKEIFEKMGSWDEW